MYHVMCFVQWARAVLFNKKSPWSSNMAADLADCCFLCKKSSCSGGKIRVFGRSSFDISSSINRALKVDLSLYVEREKLAICKYCYRRLQKYQSALQKLEEILGEIQRNFQSHGPARVKRLAKEPERPPDANKRIKIEDTRENICSPPAVSSATVQNVLATVDSRNTATKPGICVTTSARPSPVFAVKQIAVFPTTFAMPVSQSGSTGGSIQTVTVLGGFNAGQLFTAVPLQIQKPAFQKQDLPTTTETQETKVRLTVEYPSKPVRKELKDDYAVLGKAMADGTQSRIATAVLKIDGVKQLVIEKVIKLMTLQVNDLCSTRRPSMLRSTSKNTNDEISLANFDYKKVCSEWKERAPLFHAFLMACAVIKRKKNSPDCLPGVAVAGSVLLKQRNSHMNSGFAKILGIILHSKSLEKLADLSNKIQRIEIMMSILEAKLASIPGLEDVTVSTPAPGQPSGAAAASSAGSAPPPASDVPQPAAEASHPPPTEEPAPEPEKPTMTVSKDPRYAKYFQMIKVGVPIQAVAPKMTAEGLDPSYLENPDAPAPEGSSPAPQQSDSDAEMSSTSSFSSDED